MTHHTLEEGWVSLCSIRYIAFVFPNMPFVTQMYIGHNDIHQCAQRAVTWSQLIARCVAVENEALYLDGDGDYVEMRTVAELGLQERFVNTTSDTHIPGLKYL